MVITIYLCRHGTSTGNECQRLLTKNEDQLTDIGKIQANLLGLHLSKLNFDEAYSSDYQRAEDTAKLILKQNTTSSNVDIQIDENLREINYGIFTGKLYGDAFVHCKATENNILEWEFPDGESFKESGERIMCFWKDLCHRITSDNKNKTILIVSHSVAMVNFLSLLLQDESFNLVNWSPQQDFKVMKNASYMKIEIEELVKDHLKNVVNDMTKQYKLTFVEKHISDHYNCLDQGSAPDFGVKKFVKRQDGKEFSSCIHQ